MKHFTLESASLHSIPGRNVVSLQTFYFSTLETIHKRFQRSFVQRHSIIRTLCIPFTVCFYSFHTYITSHHLHISPYTFFAYLYIYILRTQNIFSSLMMPLIDWRKLGFWILRPHQNSLIFFNYAAEEQHEQIKEIIFSLGRKNNILTKRKDFMAPQVMTDVKRPDQQT